MPLSITAKRAGCGIVNKQGSDIERCGIHTIYIVLSHQGISLWI